MSMVTDCDYCGRITVVFDHYGGKGCGPCINSHKSTCTVCKGEVDSDIVGEDFSELFAQVDMYGLESATEQEQVVLEGCICSWDCYEKLE